VRQKPLLAVATGGLKRISLSLGLGGALTFGRVWLHQLSCARLRLQLYICE
jgi:hypothetical protein